MNYLKQILYELKSQKMVTIVSISGTALAIFLIMAIFMSDRLRTVEMAPVSKRSKILMGQGIDFRFQNNGGAASSTSFHSELVKKLYGNLDGVENISFVNSYWGNSDVGIQNEKTRSLKTLGVDNNYWKIYDYKFISGKPFTKEEIESENRLAILNESTARALFAETDVAGRQVDIDNIPYTISGVVRDAFPLLPDGTVSVFTNFKKDKQSSDGSNNIFGKTTARILMKDDIDPDYIKKQVKKKYEDANRELKKTNQILFYHQQPYTSAELSMDSFGSNNDPNLKTERRKRIIVYVILLLLPAINLSNMTRSRLQNRISEIGVRRAFGAKKKSIISQIFSENLIMTFIGGVIGLCFSLTFLAFLSEFFIVFNDPYDYVAIEAVSVAPIIWHIFDFNTFFIAFGACFVLNVMSSTIPAWKASRVEPAMAIAKSK